jgi:hypothetical protein
MILSALLEGYGDEIRVYSNKNKRLTKISVPEWLSSIEHSRTFATHRVPTKQGKPSRTVIIHRMYSSHALKELKSFPPVQKLLHDSKIRMRVQEWAEDVIDIGQPVFLIGINPKLVPVPAALQQLQTTMGKREYKNLPKFKLVMTNLEYSDPHTGGKTRAPAYAVEVERGSTRETLKAFKPLMSQGSTSILPASLRYSAPDAFLNAIKKQLSVVSGQYVLPLMHVTSDMMLYMEEHINAIDGIVQVVPASSHSSDGRYNVIVKKKSFDVARKKLTGTFQELLSLIPPDAHPDLDLFPSKPYIKGASYDSDSSEQSFMTASIASFQSLAWSEISEPEIEQQTSTPPADHSTTQVPTYAKVVKHNTSPTTSSITPDIETMIRRLEEQHKKDIRLLQEAHQRQFEELQQQHRQLQEQNQATTTKMFDMMQQLLLQRSSPAESPEEEGQPRKRQNLQTTPQRALDFQDTK